MNVSQAKIIDKYPILLICYLLSFLKLFSSKKTQIKNIAIVRLWALGETVLTLPMIKRIKEKYPEAKITIICSKQNKIIFENQDFIDKIILYNDPKIFSLFKKFDVAIDTEPFMHMTSLLTFWLGKNSIGYSHKKANFLYNKKVPYIDGIHVADNFIKLASPLNIDQTKLEELVPLDNKEQEWAENKVKSLKKPFIGLCITTGGSGTSRRWPLEKWLTGLD